MPGEDHLWWSVFGLILGGQGKIGAEFIRVRSSHDIAVPATLRILERDIKRCAARQVGKFGRQGSVGTTVGGNCA